jgi:dihydrolipoamide dehydrogenase
MPIEIVMPKLGLTMTEGIIVQWKKKEGEKIRKGDILFILETEKVTYEVEAPDDGIMGPILVKEKATVPVGGIVAYILKEGESPEDLRIPDEAASEKKGYEKVSISKQTEPQIYRTGLRPKASPYAKRIASSMGIDLSSLIGTGPDGMIVSEDVRKASPSEQVQIDLMSTRRRTEEQEIVALSGMRRAIAKKMMASKTQTAQTYMTLSADAGNIISLRKMLLPEIQREHGIRITITDIMMKIAGEAVKRHPIINTTWSDEGIIYHKKVHMGMAMALPDGLIVPVIRYINEKRISEVALERSALTKKGKVGRFLPDEITGSTVTLSAMGMFGIEQFTANINVPENAILAVGAIVEKPVAISGQVALRPVISITLSYDHRAIDGAEAGRFMQTLKALIEDPWFLRKIRVTVIGGGVGGYPAAITASRLGAEVTLIERENLGGVCLNWGCIPTKSLLKSCEVLKTVEEARLFGITCSEAHLSFKNVMERKAKVIEKLRGGVAKLLEAKKVRVLNGTAKLLDKENVQILETGEKICSDKIIIATGSRPSRPPIDGIDNENVWDSNAFLCMKQLPSSVVIIGGGVVGVEFAQVLARMGVKVFVLEMATQLIPGMDGELSLALRKALEGEGIAVHTSVVVTKITKEADSLHVHFQVSGNAQVLSCDNVLISVGRKPDLSLLNVDRIGIQTRNGAILVDERMETTVPGIYAAGDVVGGFMLAHKATAEGECAAKNALGHDERMDYSAIPCCVYTSPEAAWVGLSEEDAAKRYEISIGRFPFHGCGKAVVIDKTYGMVKIVAEKSTGKVLGVHILGPNATDIISEAVLGMKLGATVDSIAKAVHPHPTLSEALMEAALSLCGGAIHMP